MCVEGRAMFRDGVLRRSAARQEWIGASAQSQHPERELPITASRRTRTQPDGRSCQLRLGCFESPTYSQWCVRFRYRSCSMATSPVHASAARSGPPRPPRRTLGLVVVPLVIIAVAIAFVVGFTGLFANPVKSVNADGTTTLQGTFEPYQCNASSCDGYVQAGARSVFVQFPASCTPPKRGSEITVTARPARDLGNGSYRATRCA